MNDILYNPVYNALSTSDKLFNAGRGEVKYFDELVSPFAGFHEEYDKGFEELHDQLPQGRNILFASPVPIKQPGGWDIRVAIEGLQFVFEKVFSPFNPIHEIIELHTEHVNEMVALATLTKPGPFNTRTIEFGHYYGIFENEKLVAMTGQRLHINDYAEVSAVCTHPEYLGRGYAAELLKHQLSLMQSQGRKPFLHVRADNKRAIEIYERLGFEQSREMNFYFMKRV